MRIVYSDTLYELAQNEKNSGCRGTIAKEWNSCKGINIHTIKLIDREIIIKAIEETGKVVTIEDHNVIGGLGSAVAEVVAESGRGIKFKHFGLRGFSQGYGTYAQVQEMNGIVQIASEINKWS